MLFYVRHMPKPKQTKPPKQLDIPGAVRELRKISKESQQFFGARLRISTRALQLYESGDRVPEPKQLVAFAAFADFVNRPELTELLIQELERQLAPPPGYEHAVVFRRRSPGVSAAISTTGDLDFPPLESIPGIHGRRKK
jgi:transcriptional regulator with XRE-family HTH domain